jgi:sucrose-6F-phosphate phosphohydrolase
MYNTRILVSDIDGTLLEDGQPTPGLETLRLVLYAHRDEVKLVYATGRSFESTQNLIASGALPRPDGIAAFVGTEVWLPPWIAPSSSYRARITAGWNVNAVRKVASAFAALEPQPDRFQTGLKASYYLSDPDALPPLDHALNDVDTGARLVYSCKKYLDIVPARAGKRAAVEFLCNTWGIDRQYVLACGDSGNDADMLAAPRFWSVAVGNSEAEIERLTEPESLHKSTLPHAAGVLEGAEVFDFWPPT